MELELELELEQEREQELELEREREQEQEQEQERVINFLKNGENKMKRLVLELDDEIHSMIKIKAAKEKKSMREILTELVQRWLKRN